MVKIEVKSQRTRTFKNRRNIFLIYFLILGVILGYNTRPRRSSRQVEKPSLELHGHWWVLIMSSASHWCPFGYLSITRSKSTVTVSDAPCPRLYFHCSVTGWQEQPTTFASFSLEGKKRKKEKRLQNLYNDRSLWSIQIPQRSGASELSLI
jgi:hypothetical protein